MSTDSNNALEKNNVADGLSSFLLRRIAWIYFAILLLSLPAIYWVTQWTVYAEAEEKVVILDDMIVSVRQYIREDVRPYMQKNGIFHPPVSSTTVAATLVAKHFKESQPDYYIKVSSDNPLNSNNKVNGLERDILNEFRANPKLKMLNSTGVINGKKYLISSRPSKSKGSCMTCHGDPASAPKEILELYGDKHGYGYKLGEVVGITTVGVLLTDINALIISRGLIVLAVLSLVFLTIALLINRMVKQSIIIPITALIDIADVMSRGKLEEKITQIQKTREINDLSLSLERLRRSMAAAVKRIGNG